MPPLGGYGWLKGETTDPNDAAARGETGEGELWGNEGTFRDRTYLLTYVYLAAYLAMPLSIISCYLGEVLQPPFSWELSEQVIHQATTPLPSSPPPPPAPPLPSPPPPF